MSPKPLSLNLESVYDIKAPILQNVRPWRKAGTLARIPVIGQC